MMWSCLNFLETISVERIAWFKFNIQFLSFIVSKQDMSSFINHFIFHSTFSLRVRCEKISHRWYEFSQICGAAKSALQTTLFTAFSCGGL